MQQLQLIRGERRPAPVAARRTARRHLDDAQIQFSLIASSDPDDIARMTASGLAQALHQPLTKRQLVEVARYARMSSKTFADRTKAEQAMSHLERAWQALTQS